MVNKSEAERIAELIEKETGGSMSARPNNSEGVIVTANHDIDRVGVDLAKHVGDAIFEAGYYIYGIREQQYVDGDGGYIELWFDSIDDADSEPACVGTVTFDPNSEKGSVLLENLQEEYDLVVDSVHGPDEMTFRLME